MAKVPLVCPVELGSDPRIESQGDVDRVLQALQWCNTIADKVEADLNQKIAKAKSASEANLLFVVDGVETTVDAYADKLEAELQRWGLENRETLFTAKKSVAYGYGGLALKGGSSSIVSIGDADKLHARVWEDVKDALNQVLEAKGYKGIWRVKIEPEPAEMGKAIKNGQLKPADLQKQGFKVSTGDTKVTVTVGVSTSEKK